MDVIGESVVLQSAGSLSVAVTALIMMIVQLVFVLRRNRFNLYGWSFGISFSAMLYAIGVFFEYNAPPGPLNQWAGRLEFSVIVCLIHLLFGFTFSYFKVNANRYHQIAGLFHLVQIGLIWGTDLVVSSEFVSRHFIGLSRPYTEPALGPLGLIFIGYGFLACLVAMAIWLRLEDPHEHHKRPFLLGIALWILLGIHDGLAVLGATTVQYLMEYGFLLSAIVVLWIVSSRFYEMLAEDKYRIISELINDGILVIQDGKIVFENPACRKLAGQSVIGWEIEKLSMVFTTTDGDTLLSFFGSLIHARELDDSITRTLCKKGKTESIIEIKADTIEYKSAPAFLAVLRDITERIRKENALRKSEERIAHLKKMESLGLLAGGVAHDLNNVLTGVVSYPELILMELPEKSKLRGPVLTIQDSGKRAAAIVNELLTITRGAAIEKNVINLNRVIDIYMRSPEHKKLLMFHPKVKVQTALEEQLLNIKGSSMHFGKAVMNLVSNAAEAIEEEGKVVISTANRHLDRDLHSYSTIPRGEYVVLTVKDTGPGIGRDDLDRIFEPFYTKKVMGRSGTGLGLTLVWNVAQDHDCHIDVISDHHGTQFDIYCHTTRETPSEETKKCPLSEYLGQGERILVVDDVKNQRKITCLILDKLGYTADSASSGEAAIDYIRKNGAVDLLLLDMIMEPGMNGRETFERIKEIQPDQKAIILSGYSETEDVRQALKAGVARHLGKPVTIDVLGQAVKEVLHGLK